ETDERLTGIALLVDGQQFGGALDSCSTKVDGLENAAVKREKLGGEAKLALLDTRDLEYLGNVAVVEDGIGGEVFRDFAEAGLEARLAAGAADAGLGI